MKANSFYQSFSSKIKGRNLKSSLFKKKLFLKEKPKTFSPNKRPPTTPRTIKQIPVLSFPLSNNSNNISPSSLFLTSTNLYKPIPTKSQKIFNTIIPRSKIINENIKTDITSKRISESRLSRPVVIGKTIQNKIKESKKSQKLKRLNILDFGNNLKLYDEIEKKQKEKVILEKRTRQLDEIYFDYDVKNRKKIMNSFSGNRADLLRNKIFFVKGIVDYIYPKLVLNKMVFLNEMKENKFREGRKDLQKELISKYYKSKHRNPEQNATLSKYLYAGDLEIIRPRNNFIDLKKTLINKCIVSKLTNNYDYI